MALQNKTYLRIYSQKSDISGSILSNVSCPLVPRLTQCSTRHCQNSACSQSSFSKGIVRPASPMNSFNNFTWNKRAS